MLSGIGVTPNRSLSFKAGKTTLYADFDGTYMLYDQDIYRKNKGFINDPAEKKQFDKIYGDFDKSNIADKSNFEFIITTGRNKHEFLYFIKKLAEQGLTIPLPTKLITKNGGDVFTLSEDRKHYGKPDLEKRKEIKQHSNWIGSSDIKSFMVNLFKGEQFKIITENKSNNCEEQYGDISLETHMKNLQEKGKDYYVSYRDDGELDMHIAFPKWAPGEKIADKVKEKLIHEGINADVTLKKQDNFDAVIPHYNTGYQDDKDYFLEAGQSITLVPHISNSDYQKDGPLNKLYDVKKSMKKIIKDQTHDLVIVAGNGSNDKTMLDPFNYVDLLGLQQPLNDDERKKFLNDPSYVEKMKELPLASIIVGNNSKLDDLIDLSAKLNTDKIKKIICVDGFDKTLLDAIKTSKASYASQDEIFAKKGQLL